MTHPAPNWESLNAYVDGELDAPAAAAVAEAAGNDPAVADQIALLYRLKGVAHAVPPAAPADLTALLPAPARPRRHIHALAAATFMLIGLLALFAPRFLGEAPGLPPDVLATARHLHEKWLRAELTKPSEAPPAKVLAALAAFEQVPLIPDLAGTELEVDYFDDLRDTGRRLLQIGFRGQHGCHLSLFVLGDEKLPGTAVRVQDGAELAYGWQVGGLGYLLFAEGMDVGRFDLISREVEHATRVNQQLDAQERERLAQNRRDSASCHA